jgi:hypothetical protein
VQRWQEYIGKKATLEGDGSAGRARKEIG